MLRMTEAEQRAAVALMTLPELRAARSWALNSGTLDAIQLEVHKREADEATTRADRTERLRFAIATGVGLVALVGAIAAWLAAR